MSKELDLIEEITFIVDFLENRFPNMDGIDKTTILRTTATYYENLVTAEATRQLLIKTWEKV